MEVILIQDVSSLGKTGEVVKVKDGYARNLLIPQKLAYLATEENRRKIEQEKKRKQAQYDQEKQKAEQLAEKLSKVSCTLNVEVNDLDKLYGSISEADIAKALDAEGFKTDKKNIILEKPIEELGIFEVGVKVHPELTAKIRLWVTKK